MRLRRYRGLPCAVLALTTIAPGCRRGPPPSAARADQVATIDRGSPEVPGNRPDGPIAPAGGSPIPPPPSAPAASTNQSVGVRDLVALLAARRELKLLTPETAPLRFAGLVPRFEVTPREDELREVAGTSEDGFVRAVSVIFGPAPSGEWAFRSASIRIHPDDTARIFAEISRNATATLRRPRWMDLGERNRTAWNLGEHFELIAAVLEDGDIQLRAGLSPRP